MMWAEIGEFLGGFVKPFVKKKRPLIDHPFFKRADEMQRWVMRLPIADAMRREAFQDLLAIKLRILPSTVAEFVREVDLEGLDGRGLAVVLHSAIETAIARQDDAARCLGLPYALIHKFDAWHRNAIIGAHRFIDEICDSDWRDTREMTAAFLSWLISYLEQTVTDAEGMLADLNGELNGITYKGLIGGPYSSPKRKRRG